MIDDGKYKIVPEKIFEKQIFDLETKIDKSKDEIETEKHIQMLSKVTNVTAEEIIKSEFVRLANQEIRIRRTRIRSQVITKENVPAVLRKFLIEIYKGKCQVSNFTFIMRSGNPYFKVHHINSYKGNHFKNLVVVSPNIHAQFTHANLTQFFDNDGWLRKVRFNEETHSVFQIIDRLPKSFEKEIHF